MSAGPSPRIDQPGIEIVELAVLGENRAEVGIQVGADRHVFDPDEFDQSDDLVDEVVECFRRDTGRPRADESAGIRDDAGMVVGDEPRVIAARPGQMCVRDHDRMARGRHCIDGGLERGVGQVDDHAEVVHRRHQLAPGAAQSMVERRFGLEVAIAVLAIVDDRDRPHARRVGVDDTAEHVGVRAVLDEVGPFARDEHTGAAGGVGTHDVVGAADDR